MRIDLNAAFRAYPLTGTGQYLHHLVAALRAGYPDLRIRERSPPGWLRGNPGKVAWEQLVWPALAARGSMAVRHVPYLAPPILDAGAVVTVHDVIPFVLPAYAAGPRQRLYGLTVRWGLRRSRTIIADSAATAGDLASRLGVPTERIRVIPLGVDPRFRPDAAAGVPLRERYDLPDRYALYLGALDVRKNLGVVLRAWPRVWADTGIALVVGGRSPSRRSPVYAGWFEALDATASAWLRVLGPVAESDKPALYAGASVFVFPSRYEGFGLEPLEAMAAGTPVVAANATSIPEVLGDAGPLVDPDDPDLWHAATVRVLTDRRYAERLSERGLARARTFGWERTAAATVAVYREVAP